MTKRRHVEALRLSPIGEAGLQRIRQIVAEKAAAKVNEVFVDLFSASMIVQVYDIVNDANKAKLLTLPVGRLASVCFAAANRQRKR